MIAVPEALLPCPSCDFDKPVVVYSNDAYVRCPQCGMRGPGRYPSHPLDTAEHVDRERAIDGWNALPRRPKRLPKPTHLFTRKG